MIIPETPYSEGVPRDAPGQPIRWGYVTLEEFVKNNYWFNPEDAIGDIRYFISNVYNPKNIERVFIRYQKALKVISRIDENEVGAYIAIATAQSALYPRKN